MNLDQLIVALDHVDPMQNYRLMDQLAGHVQRVKIGSIAFGAEGPKVLNYAHQKGFSIFLDLKFYDIPHTVAHAVAAIAKQVPLNMLTVHASGGANMIQAVHKILDDLPTDHRPHILAVTVLTSFEKQPLIDVGYANKSIEAHALHMGQLAIDAGADGLVCSAWEVASLKKALGSSHLYVVPGIRMPDDDPNDQKRVTTPTQAIQNGATHVVMGRSITASSDPIQVIKNIEEMQ
jgi:orotidine-5'-phosphate decarboxylase